jgi:hypothetical protein
MDLHRLAPLTSVACQRRASDCVDAAFSEESSDNRHAFLNLALHWFRLAEEARLDEQTDPREFSSGVSVSVH